MDALIRFSGSEKERGNLWIALDEAMGLFVLRMKGLASSSKAIEAMRARNCAAKWLDFSKEEGHRAPDECVLAQAARIELKGKKQG